MLLCTDSCRHLYHPDGLDLQDLTLNEDVHEEGDIGNVSEVVFRTDKMQEIADHCNEKKTACKTAQTQSDKIFLKAYLRDRPAIETEAIVVGVGAGSLQLYIPTLAYNDRLPVSKLGYRGKMDRAFTPVGVSEASDGGGKDDGGDTRSSPIARLQLHLAQEGDDSSGHRQDNSGGGKRPHNNAAASRMITSSLSRTSKQQPSGSSAAAAPSTAPIFTLSFLSVVKVKVSVDTRPKPSEIHIELVSSQ